MLSFQRGELRSVDMKAPKLDSWYCCLLRLVSIGGNTTLYYIKVHRIEHQERWMDGWIDR